MRARSPAAAVVAVTSLCAAALAAGCVASVYEDEPLNLASLVLKSAPQPDDPIGYQFGSVTLDGSYAAYRVPVSAENARVSVHLVLGIVADGDVVEPRVSRAAPSGDPTGHVVMVMAYNVLPDGTALEMFLDAEPSLAPGYLNFTFDQYGDPPMSEVLIVLAHAPPLADPSPVHLAFVAASGVEDPQVGSEDEWLAALTELATGVRGEALAPVALGGGVQLAVYEERALSPEAPAAIHARHVAVEDSALAPTPAGSVERRLSLRASFEAPSTSRVILGVGHLGAAQIGEWSWSYRATDVSLGGTHLLASSNQAPLPFGPASGTAGLRTEAAGPVELTGEFRVSGTALPQASFFLVVVPLDVAAVLGVPVMDLGPRVGDVLPPLEH